MPPTHMELAIPVLTPEPQGIITLWLVLNSRMDERLELNGILNMQTAAISRTNFKGKEAELTSVVG